MSLPAMTVNYWTLDGVSLGTGEDDNGFSYLVQKSRGWVDGPEPRPEFIDRPSADGSYRSSNYNRSRVIELSGIAQCRTRRDRDRLADSLSGLCRNKDGRYPLVRYEYERTLYCTVERTQRVEVVELPDGVTLTWNLQVTAVDPRKYSAVERTATTGISQAALDGVLWDGPATPITGTLWDGAALPITGLVWQASSGVSGVVDLINEGTELTPVVFTITAPPAGTLVMPTITDTVRGFVLTYGGTMAAGSVLTIDTRTGVCTLDGVPVGGLMTRSDFFELPGRTTIPVQFSAAGPADGATLLATWYDAY